MITAAVYLGALRAHWRKLVALAALGLMLGLVAARALPTEYTANRLLVVTAQGGQGLTDLSQGSSVAVSTAQSLAYLGNAPATLHDALASIGVDSAQASPYKLRAAVPANTAYVEVNTVAPTQQSAVSLAQTAVEKLIAANNELTSTLADSSKAAVAVRDITPPSGRGAAWATGLPKWLLPAAGALFMPVLVYFLLVLRSAVKPTVGESLDLDEIVPFPVLGSIDRERHKAPEVVRPRPPHFAVLGRSGLMESGVGGRVVTLTAVEGPSDARPALALAQALGQLGRRVLVVDADLSRPSLDSAAEGGVADCLARGGDFAASRRRWLDSTVQVLPTGASTQATKLLVSQRAHALFDELRRDHDVVFVSSASALSGPDASAIADLSDEVILMADTSTPIDRIIDAGQSFREGSISGLLVLDRGRGRPTLPFRALSGKRSEKVAPAT